MTVHSFYVVGLREGFPLYSRKWTHSDVDSALLSGFLASMEHMAQQVAAQHINVVNMKDRRFFFQIDEKNGLLLVFITDVSESPARFRKYLGILNKQFVKMFKNKLKEFHEDGTTDTTLFKSFDEFIDDLVLTWWMGETTVSAAKVMDIFEIFTLFYNTILQKFLTAVSRRTYESEIQTILETNTAKIPALSGLRMDKTGVINYEAIDPQQIKYPSFRQILYKIFHQLVLLTRKTMPKQTYQSLVFEHISPLIRTEQDRLKTYSLTERLVLEIL
ncbi:MAG: hypothetical protein ACFFD8_01975 [Candidatus Thorarchaeota archaeon]